MRENKKMGSHNKKQEKSGSNYHFFNPGKFIFLFI